MYESTTSNTFGGAITPATSSYAQYSTHAEIPTGTRMITGQTTGQERVTTTRKVSSTVVNEQYMGPAPVDLPCREVEVPGPIQEIIKHVPRKEIVETEKRVPRYEYEYVDVVVPITRIEYVDKRVEVPQYEEVIHEVKVPKYVDVPVEVKREVKIPQIVKVEKMVEVPGPIVEVPKPYTVEQKVEMNRYNDHLHPVVVAQTVKPYIVEGAGTCEVDVYEYEPECIPVDVHVIKAVQARVQSAGVVEQSHRVITVPAAQYNTILQQLNPHLPQAEIQKLPYMTEANGQVTFLSEHVSYTEPQVGAAIFGLENREMLLSHVDQATRRLVPVPGVTGPDGMLLEKFTMTTTQQSFTSNRPISSPSLNNAKYSRTTTTTTQQQQQQHGGYPIITNNLMAPQTYNNTTTMTTMQQRTPTPILAASAAR